MIPIRKDITIKKPDFGGNQANVLQNGEAD